MNYETETLSEYEDDGTMPENVAELEAAVIGRRIVSAERRERQVTGRWSNYTDRVFTITLDDGRTVNVRDTDDCCAYTGLTGFLLHPEMVEHVITGVGTSDGYTTWHIYAAVGDVLEMSVDWSAGNPFYYGYGFNIVVEEDA